MIITITAVSGETIQDISTTASRIARLLGVWVQFQVNEKTIIVAEHHSPEQIAELCRLANQ